MVAIQENISLKRFNTFGIDAKANYFCEVKSIEDLISLVQSEFFKSHRSLILGSGSNVLFRQDFKGLVVHNSIFGRNIVHQNDESIYLKINSGELWHDAVMHCVQNNWGGIENLSLIPGTMGAAPMQNIGAYGVEVREVIESVDAVELSTGRIKTFSNLECKFGYRESIFKNELREKFFISSVTLTLTKKNHRVTTSYGAIADTLSKMNIAQPTIKNISDAVIKIRTEKLPDFNSLGNAGSFFKNPEITEAHFLELTSNFESVPHYPANQGVKVPAGWLIEQCGWKGKTFGNAGVHDKQALVLVNRGGATGDEIFSLAMKIISSVSEKFSITLTPEVNIF
ncbi:MAG TPA: UDP-N-acetylmuramate dehydrogenase [Cyclobacteriaceae bacterium]|jgi:UDP-N-acetylmuramate dehydrogenase|nr:UDP-N-acetylmuramate dehydrogenase [Cyclobacteriaceae bacterium]